MRTQPVYVSKLYTLDKMATVTKRKEDGYEFHIEEFEKTARITSSYSLTIKKGMGLLFL